MTISDDVLMSYLDNELAPEERARVDAALTRDAAVRARLKEQERVRDMLSAAFGPMIEQKVPDRLVRAAMTTPASFRWRLSDGMSRLLSRDERGPGWAMACGLSAAALVLGMGIGWMFVGVGPSSLGDGRMLAQGALARALERQLAGDEIVSGPRVGVSFRAKSGALCRTFDMGASQDNSAGIACRGGAGWTIGTLAPAEPLTATPYETVGAAMPALVRGALADMIDGEPLDAVQERQARDGGWRSQR